MMSYTLQDLFNEYVSQRNHKLGPGEAVKWLYQLKPDLHEGEFQQLSHWIRQWELDRRYAPPTAKAEVKLPPALMADERGCNNCGTSNPQTAKYCYSCGQLLEKPNYTTEHLDDEEEDTSYFGALSTLLIVVRGYEDKPIRVRFETRPLVVGRSDPESPFLPDVDLVAYEAKDRGVSRRHALLRWEEKTVTLIDQDSVNHTYINGEMLHPHEVRVLRDGDEVRFGRLSSRITFQRELRRIT